jgi:hypothetical protein
MSLSVKRLSTALRMKEICRNANVYIYREFSFNLKMDDFGFEEKTVKCTNCGKDMKIITYSGFDASDYLCPKCAGAESSIEEEGED